MADNSCIIEGNVKFRDGKKWKNRWCVMRKLSPVADCLHLQLYGDSKDKIKQGQTKASLSLQQFLGVESGFTFDKESNTIAIICQDVTVILAFDTRERLIQWQVKIANNLGEDQQFEVLTSSAPSKVKLPNGPAHLHIQDLKFCITVGVPPRLVNVWEIINLRRYGVVDGKLVFEGGARSGPRGEGVYVFLTSQGDEIVTTLNYAAEGKLSSKKRTNVRDQSTQNSPRRQFARSETRASDIFPAPFNNSFEDQGKTDKSSWSSTESGQRLIGSESAGSSDYGMRRDDSLSNSTSEISENLAQRHYEPVCHSTLERCSSCIGKIAPNASIAAISAKVACSPPPPLLLNNASFCRDSRQNLRPFDRMPTRNNSNHGSSEHFPIPQKDYHQHQCQRNDMPIASPASPPPQGLPPRPPKPLNQQLNNVKQPRKLPINLPTEQQPIINYPKALLSPQANKNPTLIGPYMNYDVPKPIFNFNEAPAAIPNYDTPKKIREHLPPGVLMNQHCGCPVKLPVPAQYPRPNAACPCHNVMSWAGFVLPYCRRGAGIEPTGVTVVHPVKMNGENNKAPAVVNATNGRCFPPTHPPVPSSGSEPIRDLAKGKIVTVTKSTPDNNYANIEVKSELESSEYANMSFTNSLENYENSRDVLMKCRMSDKCNAKSNDNNKEHVINDNSICTKCGHKFNENGYMDQEQLNFYENCFPARPAAQPDSQKISKATSGSMDALQSEPQSNWRSEGDYTGSAATLSSPYFARRTVNTPDILQKDDEETREDGEFTRKRAYSAESPRFDRAHGKAVEAEPVVAMHKCASETDKISTLASTPVNGDDGDKGKRVDKVHSATLPSAHNGSSIKIKRSSSVPSRNDRSRSSSDSNSDSGVSTSSVTAKNVEVTQVEVHRNPENCTNSLPKKRNVNPLAIGNGKASCFHGSLPRRLKSNEEDSMNAINFQFKKGKNQEKSTPSEIAPAFLPKGKSFSPIDSNILVDSRSISSGTSDMSDYIETLSLSSHSSTDTPDTLRQSNRSVSSTLRPRSGKEYCKIDRNALEKVVSPVQNPALANHHYSNIAPLLEKNESPSSGYGSGSSFEQPPENRDHFVYPEVRG